MRLILRASLLLFCFSILVIDQACLMGQNLIPNADFELVNSCPSTYNQWTVLQNWQAGNGATPDYYNCGYYGLSVQASPSSGNGVLGLWGGAQHPLCPNSAYVENLNVSLSSTMIAGKTYEISYDVQIDGSGFGSASPNDCVQVGAYFYESSQAPSLASVCSPSVSPQVFVLGSQVQKGSYTRFTFSITASDNWDRVLWGTFATDQSVGASCSSYASNKMYFNLDHLSVIESQVLASQIVAFEGEQKGEKVELAWVLGDPHLIKSISLEHKVADSDAFEALAEIPAFSEQEQYQYTVQNPKMGLNQYRLKVQTLDQGILLSEVLPFNLNLSNQLLLFPNPGHEQLCLGARLQKDEFLTIVAKDLHGRTVWVQREFLASGEHQLKLNTQDWASGMYLLDICTDSGRLNAKEKWVRE
ncbi:MAG: T9SS type A sorting domain-containing protein [Bacteroidota bacterium]